MTRLVQQMHVCFSIPFDSALFAACFAGVDDDVNEGK